jgi:histone H3/H4
MKTTMLQNEVMADMQKFLSELPGQKIAKTASDESNFITKIASELSEVAQALDDAGAYDLADHADTALATLVD